MKKENVRVIMIPFSEEFDLRNVIKEIEWAYDTVVMTEKEYDYLISHQRCNQQTKSTRRIKWKLHLRRQLRNGGKKMGKFSEAEVERARKKLEVSCELGLVEICLDCAKIHQERLGIKKEYINGK